MPKLVFVNKLEPREIVALMATGKETYFREHPW